MTNIERKVNILINGNTTDISDSEIIEVQKRLREIKNNCTIVLSQLKERLK